MQPGEKPLWVAKVHFILLLLVITTLIISWFNLNSYFIILSMAFLFVTERIVVKLKEIFSNKLFLCYFALALVELAGMLYTDNARIGWKNVEAKATLVAIPFILLVGPFRGKTNYKKIMTGYCLLLFVISLICLCLAITRYIDTGDPYVLFYHDLVDPIAQNAIVFTLFVLAAMLYLLSSNLYFGENVTVHRRWRVLLIAYFIAYYILLASKLLLVVLPFILLAYLLKRYPARQNKRLLLAALIFIGTAVTLLVTTNNPIRTRYLDIMRGDLDLAKQEKFHPDIYFNGVQLRLLEYRFAWEILNEKKAWLIGVSPGDSQDLLDAKYRGTNMYIGTSKKKDVGFLNYDSHNQFLQHLLQSGIIGFLILVTAYFMVIRTAAKERSREALFFSITLLLVFQLESMLELQHGLFLFTFFPFVFLYNINNQPKPG